MKAARVQHIARSIVGVVALAMSTATFAQTTSDKWPSRPIQLWTGFPAGGLVDIANRIIIPKLQEQLGTTIVPVPTPGAGGALASQKLMSAAPDGYTLMTQTTGTMFTRPLLNQVGYTHQNFTPIATFNTSLTTIATRKDSSWSTFADFLRDAKAQPGKFNYATSGLGGLQHLAMDTLGEKAGLKVVHVPYQGGPQTIAAVMAGDVQLVVGDNLHSELKYLATTHPSRSPVLPDVPTLKELGYDIEMVVRMMIIGPANLPPDIVARIEGAVKRTLEDRDVRKQLEDRGLEVRFEGSSELKKIWESEAKQFKERIEALGLAHYQQKPAGK